MIISAYPSFQVYLGNWHFAITWLLSAIIFPLVFRVILRVRLFITLLWALFGTNAPPQPRMELRTAAQMVVKADYDELRFNMVEVQEDLIKELLMSKHQIRVLNANFVDPLDTNRMLPLDRSLGSNLEYDLAVDIGPMWDEHQSLFYKDKSAIFPDKAIQEILSTEDEEKGAFDVEVVFASEDFTPHIVTAMISLPVATGRSIPYVNGKLAGQPGWASLRVRTLEERVTDADAIITAAGRLCIYYRNNLLQSGSIQVGISREPGVRLEKRNSGVIDFVLTSEFQKVDEMLSTRQLQLGANGERIDAPVSVNITLNDDGLGRHHMLTKYHDTANNTNVPPAWVKFEPLTSDEDLEFRSALYQCHQGLKNDFGKDLKRFKDDLKALAIIGHKFYDKVFSRPEVEGSIVTELEWLNGLDAVLAQTAIIQVARTDPADYPFPWALVYEYSIGDDPAECEELKSWSLSRIAQDHPRDKCPYEAEHRKQSNVLCPYGFWGLKHIIEQPLNNQTSLPYDPKTIGASSQALLGIAVTDLLDKKTLKERDEHLLTLTRLKNIRLNPDKPARTFDEVLTMLNSPEIVYFLCHGEFGEDGQPYLEIGKGDKVEDRISPDFWRKNRNRFNASAWSTRRPLIFINGCHTTAIRPGITLNFLGTFKHLGANAIIGTEVSLLAPMAMKIAESVLSEVVTDKRIGDAIRTMRWELAKKGNLLGLAYTPYCLADLQIKRESN